MSNIDSNKQIDSSSAIEQMHALFEQQKASYRHHPMPSAPERISLLKKLKKVVIHHQDNLAEAINLDFSCRSKNETLMAEILTSVESINDAIKHTHQWMRPSKRRVSILFAPAKNEVIYQPLGVVGIMVPWNYPIFLALTPLAAALAAGNRVLIKMSEFTPNLNAALKTMLSEALPENQVAIIEGEAEVATAFSQLPFKHILFTGSTNVGRLVMAAAAKNLTPVTLELGGKSPAIVSQHMPIKDAVQRICYGKSLNAGQTCVAPDYILVHHTQKDAFINEYQRVFSKMYPTLQNNPDYTAIINEQQHKRLIGLIDDAKQKGATLIECNPAQEDLSSGRKLAPVLAHNIEDNMLIAQEEIFGPILPIIPYKTIDDAITYITERPTPLSLYYFGYHKKEATKVLHHTQAGGVTINDTLMHLAQDDMPFGGVGDSGMGSYHGWDGFLTFSHAKSIHKKGRLSSGSLVYPPYKTGIINTLKALFVR